MQGVDAAGEHVASRHIINPDTGNVERANEVVAYALDFNYERIRRWVASGTPRPLRIYATPGGVTGRGNPFGVPKDLEAVRVVSEYTVGRSIGGRTPQIEKKWSPWKRQTSTPPSTRSWAAPSTKTGKMSGPPSTSS